MPIINLSEWGYSTDRNDPKYATRYKCRVHGVVINMVKILVYNEEYELVFDRRYCSICYDQFLQRHLEPLTEVKIGENQNE